MKVSNICKLLRSRPFSKTPGRLLTQETCDFQGKTQVKHICKGIHRNTDTLSKNSLTSWSNISQVRGFRLLPVLYNNEKIVEAPTFPESVAEGDIKWNKKVGDSVVADEVVCEIETDKTAIPVPAPGNGVILEIYAQDGDPVKSAQKLFKMNLGPGGAPASKTPKKAAPEVHAPPPSATPPPIKLPPQAPKPGKPIESPKEKPTPSPGPSLKQPPPALPRSSAYVKLPPQDPTKEITGTRSEQKVKMSRMRLRISQRLKDAQNTCAMLTTFNEIDMSFIMAFRKDIQEAFTKKHGIKMGFMSVFLKACVYALQDQPVVNAVIAENEIIYRDYIDISVAVASPKGLLVPVVRNVENMNYADIEKAINILGQKAKKGQIAVEDMDGGTFTVSNGGVFGSLMGTPIINPPQSAILGMHGVFQRPIAIKNEVVVRPMMYVALTYDHRLIDGREAVLFLRKIKAGVENPTMILSGV